MPDPSPQNIDVAKLEKLLHDTEKQQDIGLQVLKAVIIDVLRSKAAGISIYGRPFRSGADSESSVAAVLQQLVETVTLTEDELKILDKLEKEEEGDNSPDDA